MGDPPSLIGFRLNHKKAVEAITYVANKQPGLDFYRIVKVFYFADKDHLIRFGRPILGDVYIKMVHGPVPSLVYDLLKASDFLPSDLLEVISVAIEVKHERYPKVYPLRTADMSVFSRTDIRCLDEALETYGKMPWQELWDLAHSERAWIEASANGEMDYARILDGETPERSRLLSDLVETSRNLAF